jgi:hypothetical protein
MESLKQFEKELNVTQEKWTKAHWKYIALTLAGHPTAKPAKRGRPVKAVEHQKPAQSAEANYQALAHEVIQHMKETGQTKIKSAVATVMTQSWERNHRDVEGYDKNRFTIDKKLNASYTAVRKIIKSWEKADK